MSLAVRVAGLAADPENGVAGRSPALVTALLVAAVAVGVLTLAVHAAVLPRVRRAARVTALSSGVGWAAWSAGCAAVLAGVPDILFWAAVRPVAQLLIVGVSLRAALGARRRGRDWMSLLADGWLPVGGLLLIVWLLLGWQDAVPVRLTGTPEQWLSFGFVGLGALTISALTGLAVRTEPGRRTYIAVVANVGALTIVGDVVAAATGHAENGVPFWLLAALLVVAAALFGAPTFFAGGQGDPDVPRTLRPWQLPVVPFVCFVFWPHRPDLVAQILAGTVGVATFAQVAIRSRQSLRLWQDLRLRTRHYDEVLRDSRDVVLQLDADGVVEFASEAAVNVLGYRPEELVGTFLPDHVHPDDVTRHADAGASLRAGVGSLLVESRFRFAGDHWRPLEWAVTVRPDDAGWVVSGRDITDRIRLRQELETQARTDSLTGLLNRTAFLAEADRRLAHGNAIVLVVDLDHFKPVNDTLGQASGDALLQRVADWLQDAVGPRDAVARLGGDEFAVLPADGTDLDAATDLGRAVVAAVSAVDSQAGGRAPVSASVGIAPAAAGGTAISALRDADLAMYRAKLRGGASVVVFEPWMSERVLERSRQRAELEAVVHGGGLELHLQPVVDLVTKAWDGFEGLVRWPVGTEMRSPAQFIPLAEETGLIVPLGTWVLAEGLMQLTQWPDENAGMAVNVSALQLAEDDFTRTVHDALMVAGLAPERLTLEITEQTAVQDLGRTASRLAPLRELGVHVAVDDFGTGFSSLQYLTRLPVDILKIDRRFVSGLGVASEDEVLVRSMIGLAEDLGLGVVAEGVETQRQADLLRAFGCRLAQGFLFSPPRPMAQLIRLRAEDETVTAAAPRVAGGRRVVG
jgi:diguanylate cyclase (GGDEF)-like protein/PAS domain S-box-containing protein